MERKPDPLKKKVLGRGLSALLPGPVERDVEFLRIPVDQIRTSPFQPRRTFSPEDLRELVDSVREKGVLQPVLVRPTPEGYELVAGERRLRAAQAAGVEAVPAVVRKMSDRETLERT
jgi:ParB family chromosome partitioning protein